MLSENEKIFIEEKIFEDCEISVKKLKKTKRNRKMRFRAVISYKMPANDENSSQYKCEATFVSLFKHCCIV